MDIEKLMLDLDLDLDTFKAHLKRFRKKGKTIHRLDVEIMQDKAKVIYEKLLALDNFLDPTTDLNIRTINLPETMPEAAIPEIVESKKDELPGTVVTERATDVKEQVAKKVEPPVTPPAEPKKPVEPEAEPESKLPPQPPKRETKKPEPVPKPKPPAPEVKKVEPTVKETVEQKAEVQNVKKEKPVVKTQETTPEPAAVEDISEKSGRPKSTFDLFTDTVEETIADKLKSGDDPSIATRMQSKKISSLKQAIGINEKFLFINELFGGDLGRYNNVIEEFEQMTTEGSVTHLRELKIQNQWDENNEAFQKFKSLVERKSS